MLRTAQQLRNVITVFHNPSLKTSQDFVRTINKRYQDPNTHNFDLEINEKNPTVDQLNTLKSLTPLLSNVANPKDLPRPTLVSWFNGKVAVNNLDRANAILNIADKKASD